MDQMNKSARMKVLQELRKAAMNDMGSGMKDHMNKVTVAAPDKGHLEEGLDKAKSMLHKMPMDQHPAEMDAEEALEDPAEELTETPDEEESEIEHNDLNEDESPEAIDAKIMELLKKKHSMMNKGK